MLLFFRTRCLQLLCKFNQAVEEKKRRNHFERWVSLNEVWSICASAILNISWMWSGWGIYYRWTEGSLPFHVPGHFGDGCSGFTVYSDSKLVILWFWTAPWIVGTWKFMKCTQGLKNWYHPFSASLAYKQRGRTTKRLTVYPNWLVVDQMDWPEKFWRTYFIYRSVKFLLSWI